MRSGPVFAWLFLVPPTCEELEGRFGLWAHYFDLAEEGKGDAVGGLGESLDVPAEPGLRVPELSAGESQDVEVRGAQLPVQLLQRPVVRLRLLAATRHVYNQRRLDEGRQGSDCNEGLFWSTARRNSSTDQQRTVFTPPLVCDDVDLLFLGTSPERPSSPSRLSPRRNRNPGVSRASAAASAAGASSPHPPSCSAAPSASSLWGWRTWQDSPLKPPCWRGKHEPILTQVLGRTRPDRCTSAKLNRKRRDDSFQNKTNLSFSSLLKIQNQHNNRNIINITQRIQCHNNEDWTTREAFIISVSQCPSAQD